MKMNRIYCFLLLACVLGMVSCSSDDPLTEEEKLALYGRNGASGAPNVNGSEPSGGYVSRLLAPPGFERGVGYTYATGAEYLEGVAFNIFNLNYLDSIQPSSWLCLQVLASTLSWLTSA